MATAAGIKCDVDPVLSRALAQHCSKCSTYYCLIVAI